MLKLLQRILLLFTIIAFFPSAPLSHAAPAQTNWTAIKDAITLKIGIPKAFVGWGQVNIDAANHRVVPVVKNGRTLLPIRFVSESFGAAVAWNEQTATATITYQNKTASITINSNQMIVNGKTFLLDVPAELIGSRIYIPLRRLAEDVLQKKVFYDNGIVILSNQTNLTLSKDFLTELNASLKDNIGRLNYMVYYSKLDDAKIQAAKTYELVILHPLMGDLTRQQVQEIRQGIDPNDPTDDVTVLGYISVGEDMRICSLTEEEFATDPRFKGDGTGPRVDPRGPKPDGGGSLEGIEVKGNPSPGGSGFASYYLDDNNFDGKPDKNKHFNGAFVNAGDPAWFDVIDNMTIDGVDNMPGLKEILLDNYGRSLGCDGVLLDTIDTCAPNSYTNANSFNQSEFEWTAPGFSQLISKIRTTYEGKVILQNRGLFFFDPRLPHYQFSTRKNIDYLMFESYRLDSSGQQEYSDAFFRDNKHSYMPKIMAEAGRPDGFRVLSLGYAVGEKKPPETLLLKSEKGIDTFLMDIKETQEIAGFNHYLTDETIVLVNDFVKMHTDADDRTPPVWSSTFNNSPVWPPDAPKPRTGVQQVIAQSKGALLRWDMATDKNKVQYVVYYQTQPFDFGGDPKLTKAQKSVLLPLQGENYRYGLTADAYPNQCVIEGLTPGIPYYFVIRAADTSLAQNEEDNQAVLMAVPLE